MRGLALAVIAMLAVSLPTEAYAQSTSTPPAMDASCQSMNQYGFTLGLVYCVQTSIGTAVDQYVQAMQTNLKTYEAMALAVAVIVFGFKMMNSNLQEPMKESMTFLMKVFIGVFFFSQAGVIYDDIAGTANGTGSGNGIINQAIGWVTGTSGDSTLFSNLVSSNCTAPTPPSNFEGYQIWQAIDCMFSKMIGAADPATHPYAFGGSLAIIGAASLLSGTLGVMLSVLVLQTLLSSFFLIFRAVYLVLLAYLSIGFLAIFTPLVAPLLFFDSSFLTEKFKRFAGLIISSMFQPIFVLGFLAMTITVADQLIESTNLSSCTKQPTYPPNTSPTPTPPAQGWGQDGTGVCSFAQLFNHDVNASSNTTVQSDANDGAAIAASFANMMEHNTTLFSLMTGGDPQMLSDTSRIDTNPGSTYNKNAKTSTVKAAQQAASFSSNTNFEGATRTKQYLPVKQLMLTLLTFIFLVKVMGKVMEEIPEMASNITIFVGVNLYKMTQTRLEGVVSSAFSGAKDNLYKNARGKGLTSGNLKGLDSFLTSPRAAIGGAASGIGNYFQKEL